MCNFATPKLDITQMPCLSTAQIYHLGGISEGKVLPSAMARICFRYWRWEGPEGPPGTMRGSVIELTGDSGR